MTAAADVDATGKAAAISRPIPDSGRVAHRDLELYGQRIHYLETGHADRGPLVLLVHGLAGDATTWAGLLPLLGRHAHVVAPDLLGAGASAKPRDGDYSVGAHAATLRDMVRELGAPGATVIGHSFGGGVAMSFAYQFPELTRGIGLIASGGLGPEVTVALRLAALPGAVRAASILPILGPSWLHDLAHLAAVHAGVTSGDLDGLGRALLTLRDPDTQAAFLHTVRTAVTWSGQRLSAMNRLTALSRLPSLLIAGRRDGCIPHQHTQSAHQHLPRSRLELLDTGHFPHLECPEVVAGLISDLLSRELDGTAVRPRTPATGSKPARTTVGPCPPRSQRRRTAPRPQATDTHNHAPNGGGRDHDQP